MSATATKGELVPVDLNRPTNIGGMQRIMNGDGMRRQIANALPKFMAANADRVIRCLLTECQRTPALLNHPPAKLLGAVLQVTQLGLELGGPTGQAYILPFGKEPTLVIGYKGFIQMAHRSGVVRRITPHVVRAGDKFDIEFGSNQRIVHVPNLAMPDAEVTGYYCVIEMANGGTDFEYMTRSQAEAFRKRFALMKNGGPWANNFDEMALKTCIRKLAKRMPLSAEIVAAASLDEMADEGIDQNLGALVVPDLPPGNPDADLEGELESDQPKQGG